eukprot:gene22880-17020_t
MVSVDGVLPPPVADEARLRGGAARLKAELAARAALPLR